MGSGGRRDVTAGVGLGGRTTRGSPPPGDSPAPAARYVAAVATRLPAARRRQQLLEVACGVFAATGFHATAMHDIAEAAGVTKPVLYQHFRSKRDLYREVLTDVGSRLLDAIAKATASASRPREQVELGFAAYFRFVGDDPSAFQVLFGGGTRRDEEFAGVVAEVEATIADAVAVLIEVEGLSQGDRQLLARGLVGLAEGTSRAWMDEPARAAPEALAQLVADLAWRGLRGVDPAASPGR